MTISISEEFTAVAVRFFSPHFAQYVKNTHNLDIDLEHMANSFGTITPMPNYTKNIIDKCAHISNKQKHCPRKAVNGKFYCSNHSDKDKKKAPRNPAKKNPDKPIVRESEIYQNQITCKYLHDDNSKILMDHTCALVLYANDVEGSSHVIIGIYDPPKYISDDELLSRKLEHVRELTPNEIDIYENSHKLPYKYREYIDIIKEDAVNFEVENNKVKHSTFQIRESIENGESSIEIVESEDTENNNCPYKIEYYDPPIDESVEEKIEIKEDENCEEIIIGNENIQKSKKSRKYKLIKNKILHKKAFLK